VGVFTGSLPGHPGRDTHLPRTAVIDYVAFPARAETKDYTTITLGPRQGRNLCFVPAGSLMTGCRG